MAAITLQSLKLPNPILDTAANRSPIVFVVRLVHYVFGVAASNALFRPQFIAGWKGWWTKISSTYVQACPVIGLDTLRIVPFG